MLYIYQSNLTEQLTATLADIFAKRPANMSIFESEHILVQNPDMAQWLKMAFASAHGIMANVEFPLPSSFMWQLFKALHRGLPEKSPFSKQHLQWELMQLLPQVKDLSDFDWLKVYFDESEEALLQRYYLCAAIADIFDQYLMYRPDWIATWEQGERVAGIKDQEWQAQLWQQLANNISARSGTNMHRGRLLSESIRLLNESDSLDLSALPKRIAIFGLSSLPEQTLLLLNALAKHIDIYWLQLNPCEQFWLDIVDPKTKAKLAISKPILNTPHLDPDHFFLVGNPLLASMGTLGREHLSLMVEHLEGDIIEDYPNSQTHGALGVLQNEIFTMSCRGQFEPLSSEQLSSNLNKHAFNDAQLSNVRLHSCYSPLRELQVLKDQLFELFENDPNLSPNDILVMMPDVAEYAPYIHAVFDSDKAHYFPFSINDLSASDESPIVASLLRLLNLPDSRLSLSEVLSMLEVPAVLARFELSIEEFEQLKFWLRDVGVRWGWNSEHREALALSGFEQNSWQFGLRRMLLGYAMHPDLGSFEGNAPYIEIEGMQAAALGKLLMFLDSLAHYRELLAKPILPNACLSVFRQLCDDFYRGDNDDLRELQQCSDVLDSLSAHCDAVGFTQSLPRLLIVDQLKQHALTQRAGRRFRAGAINFCSLMPMRSIPFKVICLLGMNDGSFPRPSTTASFDLMQQQRRRGDRSRRLDDRYLFLEALISARDHLHISWRGRDIRDDKALPPSIVVAELQDYISEAWMLKGDEACDHEVSAQRILTHMVTEHPLQVFNADYFNGKGRYPSYSQSWSEALNGSENAPFCAEPLHHQGGDENALTLGQLEYALSNLSRHFLQSRLGVYFDSIEQQQDDNEPFSLDNLAQWQLKQKALDSQLRKQSCEDFANRMQQSGVLPVGGVGESVLAASQAAINAQLELLLLIEKTRSEAKEYKFELNDANNTSLFGMSEGHALGRYWYVKVGNMSNKDLLKAWLRHVFNCAVLPNPLPMALLSQKEVGEFALITRESACELLRGYCQLFARALNAPIALFSFTALDYLIEKAKPKHKPEMLKPNTLKKWHSDGSFSGRPGESFDPYIQRCFSDIELVWDEFVALSETHFTPLINARVSFPKKRSASFGIAHHDYLKILTGVAS